MTGPSKSEIERRIADLEDKSLSGDLDMSDFPQILMRNLREHYGHGRGDRE